MSWTDHIVLVNSVRFCMRKDDFWERSPVQAQTVPDVAAASRHKICLEADTDLSEQGNSEADKWKRLNASFDYLAVHFFDLWHHGMSSHTYPVLTSGFALWQKWLFKWR